MDGTGCLFEPFVEVASREFSTIVVRYPHLSTYDELLPLVSHVFSKVHGPCVLVAESFSGPLAARLVKSAPDDLSALVLCASFVRSPVPVPRRFGWLIRPSMFSLTPKSARARMLLGDEPSANLEEALNDSLASVPASVLAGRARQILRCDETESLAEYQGPLVYLRATRDRLVGPGAAELVRFANPRAIVREIDGPHLLLQTRPKECFSAILDELPAP